MVFSTENVHLLCLNALKPSFDFCCFYPRTDVGMWKAHYRVLIGLCFLDILLPSLLRNHYFLFELKCQLSLSVNSCCCYCRVAFHFVYIGDFSPPDGVHAIVAPPKRALMASISISSSQKSKTKSRILAPIHVESVNCSGLRDPGWLTYLGIVEFAGNRLLNGVFSTFSSDGFLTCPTSAKLNLVSYLEKKNQVRIFFQETKQKLLIIFKFVFFSHGQNL